MSRQLPAMTEPRYAVADCGGLRAVSVYVPNGRSVDDPHYAYKLDWFAALQCNFFLSRIDAISGVIDRSESFNGESFDGRVIGLGTPDSRVEDFEAFSIGAIGVLALVGVALRLLS